MTSNAQRHVARESLIAKVKRRLVRSAVSRWRKVVKPKHVVFSFEGEMRPSHRPDVRVDRYASEDEVASEFIETIRGRQGDRGLATLRAEFGRGSVLWVGWCGDSPATFLWTRRGDGFNRWFVSLESNDIVTFAMVTLPAHRGKGLAPFMMKHVIHAERGPGGRAMIDCAVWNKPSIRAISKAGYRPIAMMKPLPPESI